MGNESMKSQRWILIAAVLAAVGYVWLRGGFIGLGSADRTDTAVASQISSPDVRPASAPAKEGLGRAIFASGCFWCTEADFDKVPGVVSTTSGYTGGRVPNPDYKSVSSGRTGHTEAVEVVYDPAIVTYEELLDHYWANVDPFTAHRQFCDIGTQYRPEIFVFDADQRAAAEASKARVQQRFKDMAVVVAITNAGAFYPAEEYHQDYYKKNSAQYRFYRYGCGRDARLKSIWGDEH
jgi:peptide-methionine (S)-S-oxide reductase